VGHKVHPTGFRLGIVKGWQSYWYAEREYKDILAEDFMIRRVINKELANAAVSRIEIERAAANQVLVKIYTAKPGIVIGKSGEKVERLKANLESKTKKRVRIEINEIRQPELDAYLVGRSIAEQLEKRISFRRAMKQAVQKSMRANAKGIKIIVGGRLGGAEIARSEKEVEGKVPLHTLRADIDYGQTEAHTTFGVIGIKVWIYKGDILPSKRREGLEAAQEAPVQPAFPAREGGERRPERRRQGEGGGRGERGRGERQPRGERPPRPQGERQPRGERPARAQGTATERPPRPQGERPQRGQGGERAPRTPRPQGERPPRPQVQAQEQSEQPTSAEQARVSPVETQNAAAPEPTPQAPPPAAPETDTGATQSE
jgi:small subunit ribosomal protein S3